MKISDLIVEFFEKKGVFHIFGYIGGAITHIVDSIDKNENVKFVQTYHEQTAAIAAEGYARENRNIGVAIATSGPGATNLITGIADAYFDSIPVIYITGQVNTYEFKYDKPIRQQGFQEMDAISIVESITKYSKLIDNPEDILYELEKAYHIATSGRPGPVLLDIPMDIQRSEVMVGKLKNYTNNLHSKNEESIKKEVKEIITSSKKSLLLIGGGVKNISPNHKEILQLFLEKTQIPVICSLMGKGALDEDKINFLGMVGSYGNRCANISIAKSDLLIAIGSRLDTRQTGARFDKFMNNGDIIQIDIDNNELVNHRIENKINLNMNIECFINQFISYDIKASQKWLDFLEKIVKDYNQDSDITKFVENKSPYLLMNKINKLSNPEDIYVSDIGQNQMWAAQTLKIVGDQNFYTSGGLAPMGYAIPFSLGLSFANKNRRVIAICGDGGFHMSTQGLMLISQYKLPVKVIIINNESLGMITQFQGLYFKNNMAGTVREGGYIVPNINSIADAYSLDYFRLTADTLEDENLITEIYKNNKPCIIEYCTNGLTTVVPKLEYINPIYNPSPPLDSAELKKILNDDL